MKIAVSSDLVKSISLAGDTLIVSREVIISRGDDVCAQLAIQVTYRKEDDFSDLDSDTMATVDRLWTPDERAAAIETAAQAQADAAVQVTRDIAARNASFDNGIATLTAEKAHHVGDADSLSKIDAEIARLTALRDSGAEPVG